MILGLAIIWLSEYEECWSEEDNFLNQVVLGAVVSQVVSVLDSHQHEPGSIPGRVSHRFCKWELCRTLLLVSWFSLRSPVSSTLAFWFCPILTKVNPCDTLLGRPTWSITPIAWSLDLTCPQIHIHILGSTVVQRLECLSTMEANRVLYIFLCGNHAKMMPLVGGVSRFPSPFISVLLHTHIATPSSALKALDVRSRPILSTHFTHHHSKIDYYRVYVVMQVYLCFRGKMVASFEDGVVHKSQSDSEEEFVVRKKHVCNKFIDSGSEEEHSVVSDGEASTRSGSDGDAVSVDTTKKKRRILVRSESEPDDDVNVPEPTECEESSNDNTPPAKTVNLAWYKDSTLYDAEGSDDETHEVTHNPSNGVSVQESETAVARQKNKQKSSAKSTIKPSKSDKTEVEKIYSESQRMLRETKLLLPYHKPRQRTLTEFLQRRRSLPPIPKSLKVSTEQMKEIW
ncbi:hypothetical protein PR048_003911 [Dryococelus australis]|uniref:Uncharacterized protein n=1 Tax=Dryococelus australis TaxID=614101 RepID=A0ABQ9IQ53_9NEOP|nr:hypothetical protein PR048_003911 [Dryococelus australis]